LIALVYANDRIGGVKVGGKLNQRCYNQHVFLFLKRNLRVVQTDLASPNFCHAHFTTRNHAIFPDIVAECGIITTTKLVIGHMFDDLNFKGATIGIAHDNTRLGSTSR